MPNYQNPYYNPYLSNQYMPSYQNINSYQQPQNNISGAVVNDFNSITANDVPMDGKPATFIKNDLSEIQLRSWTPNGQIQNIVFKPVKNDSANNSKENEEKSVLALSDEVTDLFNGLNERLDKIEKALVPKTTRKKVDVDE